MPKRLLVTRHAKSSWKSGPTGDHARPLNKRGRHDARRVAAHLVGLGWVPERVLSSDARRTEETLELMLPVFEPEPEVDFVSELYLAGPSEVAQALSELPNELETVMVLGHNEGWEDVVAWLTGERVTLTTANAALLSLEDAPGQTWTEALHEAPAWNLHSIVRPKELPG